MKTAKQTNRRGFIDKLIKGSALVTMASLLLPSRVSASETKNSAASIYAMWTHGNDGKMEGVSHSGKDSVSKATRIAQKMLTFHSSGYFRGSPTSGMSMPGNSIYLRGEAVATMIPTSGGGQFTIWDGGTKSKAKNGEFWVHYTIPAPVLINSVRVKTSKILIKCASTDANFYISDIELWDANKRIYNKNNQKLWGPDKMHAFTFGDNPRTVLYGLCLSLKIKGERVSADRILEISGVGVDLII